MKYLPYSQEKFLHTELHLTELGNEALIANTAEYITGLTSRTMNKLNEQFKRLERFEDRKYKK